MSYVFCDQTQLDAVRANLDKEPWASGFQAVKARADEALSSSPRSVTDNGAPQNGANEHYWGDDGPYQEQDGVTDPDANREDYMAARHTCYGARDMALVYRMTGKDKYAKAATDWIHHWALDPETYMHPSAENYGPHQEGFDSQTPITIYITVPALIYAASLVRVDSSFDQWVQDLADDMGLSFGGIKNNHWAWWNVLLSSVGAYLGDSKILNAAADNTRWSMFQVDSRGFCEKEIVRTKSLHYSLYAIKAWTLSAEILRDYNIYEYKRDGYRPLKKALDRHTQYIIDPGSWPHEQISDYSTRLKDGAVSYEFAYSRWQEQAYMDALQAAGRPVDGDYVSGRTPSLTHASLQDLDTSSTTTTTNDTNNNMNITESSHQDGHPARDAFDGNPDTRWAAKGDGEWIAVEFPDPRLLLSAEILFYGEDVKGYEFEIQVSLDGKGWTTVLNGKEKGNYPDTYDIGGVPCRHVRYLGRGQRESAWNSVHELVFDTVVIRRDRVTDIVNSQ